MQGIWAFLALCLIRCQAEGFSAEVRRLARSEPAPSKIKATRSAKQLSCSGTDFVYDEHSALSEEHLNRAEVSLAGAFRLQRLYNKLKTGTEDIKIAVLGGSVEHCHTCPPPFNDPWQQYVSRWLKKAFALKHPPLTRIVDVQLGTGVIRLKSAFDFSNKTQARDLRTYDLVLVAGLTNYPLSAPKSNNITFVKGIEINRYYAEAFLRELLAEPHAPAVLIVAWLNDHWWKTSTAHDMSMHTGMAHRWGTWQDEVYQFLAMYYEISMVSGRNALLHSMFVSTANPYLEPRFNHTELVTDRLHPTPLGHNVFGQLVIRFLCKQLKSIQDGPPPVTAANSSVREYHLPPPVFSNASRLVALRRVADFSGFPEDMTLNLMLSNDSGEAVSESSANLSRNPDDVAPLKITDGLRAMGVLPSVQAKSSNSSGIDPDVFFKRELHAAVLPLLFMEAVCWVRQGMTSSSGATVQDESARGQGVARRPFALEPLRLLGVSHIVLMHDDITHPNMFHNSMASFVQFGRYWVPFFFALSGYVLYLSQRGAPQVRDPVEFVRRRMVGVYPMFLVGVLVSLSAAEAPLAAAAQYANGQLLPGFLMIDSWAEPYGTTSPNAPAWFLCTLFCFWLCFPRWYSFVHNLRSGWTAVLFAYVSSCCIPMAYKVSLLLAHRPHLIPPPTPFASFHPLSNWPPFVFGMGVARLSLDARFDKQPALVQHYAASVALGTLLLVFYFLPWPMPGCPGGTLEIWMLRGPLLLPFYGVLLFFVPAGEDLLLKPDILESPIGLLLGSVSGPLFALHWPVQTWMVNKVVKPRAWYIVAAQFLAAFTYHYAEESIRGKPRRSGKGATCSAHKGDCGPVSPERQTTS
mmetsp:Transcript_82289/g.156431  ORF Transcript_82289/g.156431 Transcript_82289/m.156431 type:complete len:859 (+) Transcript_82289:227-2803(+)